MADIAKRFKENPILTPADLPPSQERLKIECVFNPGAFKYKNKTWLLLRVAERPVQKDNIISLPVLEDGKIKILEFDKNDPDLDYSDPRKIMHGGNFYLTTISHLRLVNSDDGINFHPCDLSPVFGEGKLENYGIEDCRVTEIAGRYYLTYSAVSENGIGVGMRSTSDWINFEQHGVIISGPNKDCAIFPEKINGLYYCLHRPCNQVIGGLDIWTAQSPDLNHWGNHQHVMKSRQGTWDSARIGAGAAPIRTEKGWLIIYHGADKDDRYCLGAALLDLTDPAKILARSDEPIMEPKTEYERNGFFGNVVFTNGHIVDGDTIYMYYGASDEFICGATFSIEEMLGVLKA